MVIPDAAPKAALGSIRVATFPLNRTTEPTAIPGFDCTAMRVVVARFVLQVICISVLELNLRPTAMAIRRAICRVSVRSIRAESLAWDHGAGRT